MSKMRNIHYNDFPSRIDLNDWALRHVAADIINIETISKYPAKYRVWYYE